eukprot:14914470-Alexandrium_andersonii.AAC.1
MSASLVGSEMCIRDSLCALMSLYDCARTVAVQVTLPDIGIPHESEDEPVSYTHLTLPTICSV